MVLSAVKEVVRHYLDGIHSVERSLGQFIRPVGERDRYFILFADSVVKRYQKVGEYVPVLVLQNIFPVERRSVYSHSVNERIYLVYEFFRVVSHGFRVMSRLEIHIVVPVIGISVILSVKNTSVYRELFLQSLFNLAKIANGDGNIGIYVERTVYAKRSGIKQYHVRYRRKRLDAEISVVILKA